MILGFIEFLWLIIKTLFYSFIYTSLILICTYAINLLLKNQWIQNRLNKKVRNLSFLFTLIFFSLLYYSNSYWENIGFGESPSIPIGYEQRIYSPDFSWVDFYPDLNKTELNKDEVALKKFIIVRHFLCAEIDHKNSNSPKYNFIVCNLKNKTNKTFLSEDDYNHYRIIINLPSKEMFKSFNTHYSEYVNNKPEWKKWLLP